ncbi:MAG: SUMF1/EgtB/PvdO family nonheme iron enzyme [Victivallales bacterium]|nr:SUMF1/EgtB/PvdO family nonheme iron enzyme [Victivallales bacterium]
MTQPHNDTNQTGRTAPHSDTTERSSATVPPSDGGVYARRMDVPLPPEGLPLLDGKYLAKERFAGGMGVVYKCVKQRTGQVVALKTVLSDGPMTKKEIEALRRNYDRVHALSHDHIVRVNALEVDDVTEQWYVEMDWVEGESLEAFCQRLGGETRQGAQDIVRVLRHVAEALDYAHGRGVVHRDVKDANIIIDKATGNAVLIDFGIASRSQRAIGTNGTLSHEITAATTASVFAGTRGYQSPEQWRGERAEAASDEYSLAVTAYRCLSGHLPFWSANEGMLQEMVLNDGVPPVKSLSSAVNAVFQKALAKRPSDRYGSCVAFIDALEKGLSLPAGNESGNGIKTAVVEKDASFSMQEFYILSGNMEERFANYGKREWDRGQTFGSHLDAFSQAMRGAKAATVNKDYSVAYSLYKQAEGEWKWLEPNEPLRKAAATGREKAVTARNAAEKAAAERLAADKLQEAAKLMKAAEDDFESGRFDVLEKKFIEAEKAFANASKCALKAKRVEDLEMAISTAIEARRFSDARHDVGELRSLDAAKAASWEASLEKAETDWKNTRVVELEESIRKSIEAKRFDDARHDVGELKRLDAAKAASWEMAIASAAKAKRVEDLEASISKAIATKDFDGAQRLAGGLQELNKSKAEFWKSAIKSAYVAERIVELETSIPAAIESKQFANARHDVGELKRLDAAKAASWEVAIESAYVAERIVELEESIREAVKAERLDDARHAVSELRKLDAEKAVLWEAKVHAAEASIAGKKIIRLIGKIVAVVAIVVMLTVLFKPIRPTIQQEGDDYVVTLKPGVDVKLIKVASGTFNMGSENSESDERPVHRVTLTKDFWLGETEVTQAQYEAVMGKNPSYFKNGGDHPVESVSWHDAKKFCDALNRVCKDQLPSGYEFSLPTEAQWEYAARGGGKSKGYGYSGGDNPDEVGWYVDNSNDATHPVRQKKPNELGLYDMSGNVWEWCRDSCEWKDGVVTDTYRDGVVDPWCRSGSGRVLRGGSWRNDAGFCHSAYRFNYAPSSSRSLVGFRLALAPVQRGIALTAKKPAAALSRASSAPVPARSASPSGGHRRNLRRLQATAGRAYFCDILMNINMS